MKVYKVRNKITGKFYTGNHHVTGVTGWSNTGRTQESLQDLKTYLKAFTGNTLIGKEIPMENAEVVIFELVEKETEEMESIIEEIKEDREKFKEGLVGYLKQKRNNIQESNMEQLLEGYTVFYILGGVLFLFLFVLIGAIFSMSKTLEETTRKVKQLENLTTKMARNRTTKDK